MRKAEYKRVTRETDITARVNLDGSGEAKVDTSIKFLDHMLTSLVFLVNQSGPACHLGERTCFHKRVSP